MRKLATFIISIFAALAFSAPVYAANVSVRVEQPKTPTNQNDFPIHFVSLDLLGRTITVKCLKQAPGEGSFTQMGTDQTLADGGNSGVCSTGSSIVTTNGTYAFKVTADAGGDHAEETVTVTYNTSGPGDVRDYNKTRIGSCQYGIHFKTADDSGKTVKVEIYRSDSVPFTADSGSRTQTVFAGSNEIHDVTDTAPDCNKTYYYAVRAFDNAGNGSALIGDDVNSLTVINPTGQPAQGAIPVSSTNGNVLGATNGSTGSSGEGGQVEGLSSPSAETVTVKPTVKPGTTVRNMLIGGGILLVGALLYAIWTRRKNQTEA